MRASYLHRFLFSFVLLLLGPLSIFAGVASAQQVPKVDISVEKTLIRENLDRVPAGTVGYPVQHEDVTFEIVVTNHGPDDAVNVQIRDELSTVAGLKNRSVSDPGTFVSAPNAGVWTIASLPVNASKTLYLYGTIDQLVFFTNTAGLNGLGDYAQDQDPSNDYSTVEVEPQVPVIDVSIDKIASVAWIPAGQTMSFDITVSNASSATGKAKSLYVADNLPPHFIADAVSGGPLTLGPPIMWSIAELAPGASETFTITGHFNATAPADVYQNCASVMSVGNGHYDTDWDDYEACATVDVGPPDAPATVIDLDLTKTASASEVEQGGSILFTINVTNNDANATVNATSVFIKDYLPTGVFSSISPVPAFASINEPHTWIIDEIGVGETVSLTINATVNHYAPVGAQVNCAEVWDALPYGKGADSSTGEEGNALVNSTPDEDDESCVSFTVIAPAPDPFVDLSIEKILFPETGPFEVGTPFSFQITVSNDQSATTTATNVWVNDVVTGGLNIESGTPANLFNLGQSSWLIPAIAPGDSEVLTITVWADTPGTLMNCALIEYVAQTNNGTDLESCANVEILAPQPDPEIDLHVVKTVNVTSAYPGDTVKFTVNVTNELPNATTTALFVAVRDILPDAFWPIEVSPAFEYGDTWQIEALDAGDHAAFTITARVEDGYLGDVTNCAQIWETTPDQTDADSQSALQAGGQATGDSRDCATVNILEHEPQPDPVIDLEISKTASSGWVEQGGSILFTINVSNTSTATINATNIFVKDVLPQGVFSSVTAEPAFSVSPDTWVIDELEPGAFALLTINATVDHYAALGVNQNCARIWEADQDDLDPSDNEDCATFDVTKKDEPKPDFIDLELTKTVNGAESVEVHKGDTVTFEIIVTNNDEYATLNATDIYVRDVLPQGLEYPVPSPDFASYETWKIDLLEPGQSAILTLTAKISEYAPQRITNCAEVYFATPGDKDKDSTPAWLGGDDYEDDHDCADIWVREKSYKKIDLELTKTLLSPANPAADGHVEFEITVLNNPKDDYGQARPTATAHNVFVTDYLPAGLTLTSYEPASIGGNLVDVTVENDGYGKQITWELKEVPVGYPITFTLHAKVASNWSPYADSYGKLTNCAEIWDADEEDWDSVDGQRADERLEGGPYAEDDQDCASVSPGKPHKADLALFKTVDDTMPKPGDDITFTVTVKNTGAATTGVKIKDLISDSYDCFTLDENTLYPSSGWVEYLDQDGFTWIVDVADTEVLRISGWVTCETPFTNSVWIESSGELPDASTDNNEASVTVTPKTPAPTEIDLSLVKRVSNKYPSVGQKVEFVLEIANAGPADATGVQIIDYLPNGLSYVPYSATEGYGISFDEYDFTWSIDKIRSGESVSLSFKVKADYKGEYRNCAEVLAANQWDKDSTPGSQNASDWDSYTREDDEDCADVWVSGTAPVSDAICYLVADNDNNGYGSADVLTKLGSDGHYETVVGATGTEMIEAIAFNPWNGKLYAADARRLGIIDPYTGYFSPIGEFGQGDGVDHYGQHRTRGLLDVDGLAFDPHTEKLFGSVRKVGEPDLLFQIDPYTGHRVEDAFGYGYEYVTIYSTNGLDDIDDIAIDPSDGTLYAINNEDGEHSRLVKIDKHTGHVIDVRQLPIGNVEGLAFFGDGTLYGTGGEGYEAIVIIDKYSLNVDVVTSIGTDGNRDYEAIDCLTTPVNELRVTVFADLNANGVQEFGEAGFAGQVVELFRDRNESGIVDDGDVLLATTVSDASGRATFATAANGSFIYRLQEDMVPSGASLTTDDQAATVFGGFGATSAGQVGLTGATATANENEMEMPTEFALEGNYPNPFNPTTTISFAMPESGAVRLAVYDLLGRELALLVDGTLQAGRHNVSFDALGLVSGTYLYRLDAGGQTMSKTMTLLK